MVWCIGACTCALLSIETIAFLLAFVCSQQCARYPVLKEANNAFWLQIGKCFVAVTPLPVHSTGVGRAHEAPWTSQTKWTCCVCLPRSSCLNSSSHCREPRLIVELCQLLQELETASFLTDLACYGWMNSTVFLRTSPDPWTCSFLRGPNLKS